MKWQTRSSHLIIYNPNLFKVNLDSFFLCQWNTLTALFFSWFFLAPLDVLTTIIPLHRILTATEHSAQEPWTGAGQVNFGNRWKLSHQRVWVSLSSSICHLKHCICAWLAKISLGTSAGTSWCCTRMYQLIFIWRYRPWVSSFINNSPCPSLFTLSLLSSVRMYHFWKWNSVLFTLLCIIHKVSQIPCIMF